MTFKNTKTLLPVLTIALIAAMFSIATEPVFASTYGSWDSPTQYYYCHSTLTKVVTTENTHECNNLSVAAGTWNQVSDSDWNLNRHTTYQLGDVVLYPSSSSSYLAVMYPTPTTGTITSIFGYVSTQYTMGNHASGDTNVYDYNTLMIHEFGHVAGLDHTWWPWSVMVEGQSTSDQRLTLDWTDKSDLQEMY